MIRLLAPTPEPAAAELAPLERAKSVGYIVATGTRLVVLREFRQWCRQTVVPSVEIHHGKRESRVLVDGSERWRGLCADAEAAAVQLTAERDMAWSGG